MWMCAWLCNPCSLSLLSGVHCPQHYIYPYHFIYIQYIICSLYTGYLWVMEVEVLLKSSIFWWMGSIIIGQESEEYIHTGIIDYCWASNQIKRVLTELFKIVHIVNGWYFKYQSFWKRRKSDSLIFVFLYFSIFWTNVTLCIVLHFW